MSSDGSTSSSAGSPAPDPAPENGSPGQGTSAHEDEVSLLDILLVLVRNKMLIGRTVLVFALLGTTYAVLASAEFTSSTRVVRESQAQGGEVALPGGISPGAISGLGIDIGGTSSGLTPQAFPDVLEGRKVRLSVVRDTFRFPDVERPMTFVDYVNRPPGALDLVLNYTLKLPWTLKSALGNAISDSPAPAETTEAGEPALTKEEDESLGVISEMVSTSVNQESGLMTISVVASSPRLAADLTESFLDHFTTRVREIRTEKVRERLDFVERRFQEVGTELEAAEDRLAEFLERNQNPNSARLQFQRDRLERQVSFKEQLYSELQSQLTQTRLDLQRRQPVVTVVEEPVPPVDRSAPRRTFIVLLMVVVGILFGVVGAFLRVYFRSASNSSVEGEKLEEIKASLRLWEDRALIPQGETGSDSENGR